MCDKVNGGTLPVKLRELWTPRVQTVRVEDVGS